MGNNQSESRARNATRNQTRKNRSLDEQLAELTSLYTQQEINDAFGRLFEQSFNKAFGPLKKFKTLPFNPNTQVSRSTRLPERDGVKEIGPSGNLEECSDSPQEIFDGGDSGDAESKEETLSQDMTEDEKMAASCNRLNVSSEIDAALMSSPRKTEGRPKNRQEKPCPYEVSFEHAYVSRKPKSSGEPWICDQCGKVFKSRIMLQQHIRRKTQRERDKSIFVKCTECDKEVSKFFLNKHMKKHMKFLSPAKPVICDVCGKQISSMSNMKKHMTVHEENREFRCSICDKPFTTSRRRDGHERRHSQKVEGDLVKCTICDKEFSKQYIKRHVKLHSTTGTYVCETCGRAFPLEAYLKKHVIAMHSEKRSKFYCEICSKPFTFKSNLSRHRRTHTGDKRYRCSICDKAFSSSDSRNSHERKHRGTLPHKCSQCPKSFNVPVQLRVHERIHTGHKPFTCSFCGRAFMSKPALRSHEAAHTGASRTPGMDKTAFGQDLSSEEMSHKCTLCAREFKRKWTLFLHILSHSKDLKQCLVCDQTFHSSSDLQLHIKSDHLGEKPYKCSTCGEGFYSLYRYHIHRAYHKYKDPFKCHDCGCSYSSYQSLMIHKKAKHSLKTVHQCETCGKTFSFRNNLLRHKAIHAGTTKTIKCSVCGKDFSTRGAVKTHMWTHRAEKRYNCDQCDRGFNDKRALMSHSRIHQQLSFLL